MNGVCKVKRKLFRLYNKITIHLPIFQFFVEYPQACTLEAFEEDTEYFQIIKGKLNLSFVKDVYVNAEYKGWSTS